MGASRFDFPRHHIESDNRLTWVLGRMDAIFRDRKVLFVHLKRSEFQTARSFLKRWDSGIMKAYRSEILMQADRVVTEPTLEMTLDYVHTVNANVELFLRSQTHTITMFTERARSEFPVFWETIEARGDLDAGLAEWDEFHNASD